MNPETRVPSIIVLALGVVFIIFNKAIVVGIRWLDKTIWSEKVRRLFPGHGGNVNPTPLGVIILGASWILVAIVLWFCPKR